MLNSIGFKRPMTRKEKTLSERSKLEDQTQNILEYLNNINHEHSIKLSAKQKPPSEDSFITFPPPKKESKESLPVDLCHKGQWVGHNSLTKLIFYFKILFLNNDLRI